MIWKLQTTFSNLSSMKVFEFQLQFHWSLFPRVQLIISQHWFRSGLAPSRRETITRINADPIHRCIYTALGGNKITKKGWSFHCGLEHLALLHLKYSILYMKRCLSVPSHYQYWLQIIAIHPRAISQNISKIWWQFFMHLSMVNELISKPCTSWVSVS